MLPEMAVSYSIGLVPSAVLTGLHLYLHRRKIHSASMRSIQNNLGKIGLFWCDTESSIRVRKETSLERDIAKYRRSVFLLGGLCLFLSWLGFLIQLGIMTSIRYLAMSRIEQKLFASRLAEGDLPVEDVRRQIDEYRELDPRAFSV